MNILRTSFAFLLLSSIYQLCAAESESEKPEALQIVLFMFFGIGIGILFMQILNKIGDPVPYTVVVFIAGILLSLSNRDGTGKCTLSPTYNKHNFILYFLLNRF